MEKEFKKYQHLERFRTTKTIEQMSKENKRPIFTDFVPKGTKLEEVHKMITQGKYLYSYICALEEYIDEKETNKEQTKDGNKEN